MTRTKRFKLAVLVFLTAWQLLAAALPAPSS
jgi:hypothetical protein